MFTWPVILGAFGIALILMILSLLSTSLLAQNQPIEPNLALADLTVIPPPTPTPMVQSSPPEGLLSSTPTAAPDTLAIGMYVQITGTEGDGLRLRSAPGLTTEPLLLGFDEEVFLVRDGPQEADGYTWWYLVAPYDETRAGWAAANFLAIIPPPNGE